MKRTAEAVLILLSLPLVAHAGCKELAASVDAAHKEIAALETSIALRQSTPSAEVAIRLKQANHLAAINANVQLMERGKCPLSLDPITGDGSAYSAAAGKCAMPGNDSTSCARETWKRNP